MAASRKDKAFADRLSSYKDKSVEVIVRRTTLPLNRWVQMQQPPPNSLYWILRNESTPQIIDVSHETEPPATDPQFYRLTARGTTRDSVYNEWIPPAIWCRVDDAATIVYFEFAVPYGEGVDSYRDMNGGLPG